MLARVAHELGGRVEAERLGIEHRGGEDVGVAAFHPARGVDEEGEARRVALGKAVFAETLDLAEAALGEVAAVTLGRHALDHFVLEGLDRADAAERRHRAPEPVCFRGREAGDDGDLHRLLLEKRHAERFLQDRLELRRRIDDFLEPLPAPQIGMHHVALDRARPHDRDLDHEIVEFLGLEARQHRHLRPALDLEHADRVGALDHGVDLRLLRRDGRERQPLAVMPLEEIEALRQRRQHAEREHVDLEQAERVEIVLVPFDGGALLHRRIHDGSDLVKPVAGDDEAAAVLGEMARKAGQFARHLERELERRIGGIEPGGARGLLADRRRAVAPGGPVQRRDHVVGEAEDFCRLADRRARAVGGHCGGEPRPLAPIAPIDVLDDLLASLVLEIDVDVRRLVALGRDEALEQKIEARGIDLGDSETEADRRIRRRAAALAQDSARAGEAHDVVHGEKIGRVVERGDEGELVLQRLARLLGNALGIARLGALEGEGFERGLGARKALAQLFGVAVRQLVEAEGEAVEEADRLLDRLRGLGEQPRHFARAFQMALGVGLSQAAGGLERRLLADAGDDVGERAPLGRMHQRVVGRNQRRAELFRQRRPPGQRPAHVLAVSQARADPQAPPEGFAQAAQDLALASRRAATPPPPLWGRDGVGGRAALGKLGLITLLLRGPCDPPPLPHKGGGDEWTAAPRPAAPRHAP